MVPSSTPREEMRNVNPGKAGYFIDGELYYRVTSVLGVLAKPMLVPWAAKLEREYMTKAALESFENFTLCSEMEGQSSPYESILLNSLTKQKAHAVAMKTSQDIGTDAHKGIETSLHRRMGASLAEHTTKSPEAQAAVQSFEHWYRGLVSYYPIYVEQTLHSKLHGYAGTADLVGTYKGITTVDDWKTGNRLYPEAKLQLAAYAFALIEMGHAAPPVRARITRFDKTPGMPMAQSVMMEWEEVQQCFQQFLNCLALFRFQKTSTWKI